RAFFDRPRSLPASFRLLVEDRDRTTAFDREVPASVFPFDALRSFDLPQLLDASPAQGLIVNPLDGDGKRLAESAARRLLPMRIGAASAEEPDQRIGEFLDTVLTQRRREATKDALAAWLHRLDGRVLPEDREPAGMLARDVRSRLQEASLRESQAWEGVHSREDW